MSDYSLLVLRVLDQDDDLIGVPASVDDLEVTIRPDWRSGRD